MVPKSDWEDADVAHASITFKLSTYRIAPSFEAIVTEKVYWPLVEATNTPAHLMLYGNGFALVPQASNFVSDDSVALEIVIRERLRIPVPITGVP